MCVKTFEIKIKILQIYIYIFWWYLTTYPYMMALTLISLCMVAVYNWDRNLYFRRHRVPRCCPCEKLIWTAWPCLKKKQCLHENRRAPIHYLCMWWRDCSLITDDPFKFCVSELKVPPHNRSTHICGVVGILPIFMAHGIDSQSVKQDAPVNDAICVPCVFPVSVNALLRIICPAVAVVVGIITWAVNQTYGSIVDSVLTS